MRIDGTDAITRAKDSRTQVRDARQDAEVKISVNKSNKAANEEAKNMSVPIFGEQTIADTNISERAVRDAIARVNKAIAGANRQFEFSVHEKTNRVMVKVIDTDTKEIVREIPPEKILDMVAQMWEMAGILVDERR